MSDDELEFWPKVEHHYSDSPDWGANETIVVLGDGDTWDDIDGPRIYRLSIEQYAELQESGLDSELLDDARVVVDDLSKLLRWAYNQGYGKLDYADERRKEYNEIVAKIKMLRGYGVAISGDVVARMVKWFMEE